MQHVPHLQTALFGPMAEVEMRILQQHITIEQW